MELIFERAGIPWYDPQSAGWAVPWHELRSVSISRTVERWARPVSHLRLRLESVRLDLFPADTAFRSRHPEMEHPWEFHRVKEGYRLPLGRSPRFIPTIDHRMRTFGPAIYGGVQDKGFTLGLY